MDRGLHIWVSEREKKRHFRNSTKIALFVAGGRGRYFLSHCKIANIKPIFFIFTKDDKIYQFIRQTSKILAYNNNI